jgi:uncharacterized protein YggE
MYFKQVIAAFALLGGSMAAAQQTSQVQLKIESSNRTLTVSAEERVTVDPDLAILHIGFETQLSDAKTAYAAGAKASNTIVAALKKAGIPETSIRSESQRLESQDYRARKYKLVQQWTVKTPPERAAEILDVAVAAGATDSGQIDWTMNDEKALEDRALDKAAARARDNASVLAKGMGVKLGALIYVTNQVAAPQDFALNGRNFSEMTQLPEGVMARAGSGGGAPPPQPLAIEPRKVSRVATVYAVFAIE